MTMATLDGKVAIVTGGGTGIGRATAILFASEGARVVVFGRRPEPLADVVAGNHQGGWTGFRHQRRCRLARRTSNELACRGGARARRRGHPGQLLAAVRLRSALLEISAADFAEVLRINLVGAFVVTKTVAASMRARGGGSIIHIGSALGTVAAPDFSPYVASKGGLHQFARAAAVELCQDEIRVNVVAPGTIDTTIGHGRARVPPASPQAPDPDRPPVGHVDDIAGRPASTSPRTPRATSRAPSSPSTAAGPRRSSPVVAATVEVVAAVVERAGRYLITRRLEGTHLAGLWEFPGGKVLPGEKPEDALRGGN